LRAAQATVSTGIIVFWVVVVGPVVVVESEGRCSGKLRGGELEVVEKGKRLFWLLATNDHCTATAALWRRALVLQLVVIGAEGCPA
jgi:hypothetical protein